MLAVAQGGWSHLHSHEWVGEAGKKSMKSAHPGISPSNLSAVCDCTNILSLFMMCHQLWTIYDKACTAALDLISCAQILREPLEAGRFSNKIEHECMVWSLKMWKMERWKWIVPCEATWGSAICVTAGNLQSRSAVLGFLLLCATSQRWQKCENSCVYANPNATLVGYILKDQVKMISLHKKC